MIPAGNDLKYRVDIAVEGFDRQTSGLVIRIRNGFGQVKWIIGREDFLTDIDGNLYFVLKAVPAGVYTAVLTLIIPDGDFQDGRQQRVYENYLVTVGHGGRHAAPHGGTSVQPPVTYTRVLTVGLADGTYIYDVDGNPIIDNSGNRVRLSLTAQQVKDLLEGRNNNGVIDTVPELMDAAGGMDENTEYGVMSDEDAADMMSRIFSGQ